jgi:hypothetical protein
MRKGLPLPKLPRREALRRRGKLDSPAPFVGRTIPLTSALKNMRSIDIWQK